MKDINPKVLKKCLLTGILMMATGMVLQVAKGQLFFKKAPPELGFIVGVVVAYIIMGFLYAFVFFIFRKTLPGGTPFRKGLIYSGLVSLIVMIPGDTGVIAFDFSGGFNLLTPPKIEDYVICMVDVLNLIIGGLIVSRMFKPDIQIRRSTPVPKLKVLVSGISGAVLFPLMMLALHLLAERILPLGIQIPESAKTWYYTALIAPSVLTGLFLPLYYATVKETFRGRWPAKAFRFFLVIYLCYWTINNLFLLPFGYSLETVLFYLLISLPSLLAIIFLSGYIIEKAKRGTDVAREP